MNASLAHLRFAGGYLPSDSKAWRTIVPAVLVAVCLVGFVGNLCVLGILLHRACRGRPSLIHSLILNLSLADLSLLLFSAPVRAAAYARAVWDLGWFVCKSSDWFAHTCMAAKSLTTVAMAKVCFMYARDPATQVSVRSCTIWWVLAATWAVAGLLALPECFFSTAGLHAGVEVCLVDVPAAAEAFASVFGKLYPLLVFGLPLSLASFYFWRARGQRRRRGTKSRHLRSQVRAEQLTGMLLSMAVTSAALWLPEWVAWLWLWHLKAGSPAPPQGFVALAQVLMFATASANPLLFLAMSGEFKESLKGLWKWMVTTRPPAAAAAASREPPAGDSEALPDDIPSPESPVSTPGEAKTGSPASRRERSQKAELPVLPDVEQFWHERDTNPCEQDNDPIPWEHGDRETGDCAK